jgi:hypothetical protein
MGQERLNALAVLSIHKDVTADTPRFNQKVIELFASQKNRRGQFLKNKVTFNEFIIPHNFHELP